MRRGISGAGLLPLCTFMLSYTCIVLYRFHCSVDLVAQAAAFSISTLALHCVYNFLASETSTGYPWLMQSEPVLMKHECHDDPRCIYTRHSCSVTASSSEPWSSNDSMAASSLYSTSARHVVPSAWDACKRLRHPAQRLCSWQHSGSLQEQLQAMYTPCQRGLWLLAAEALRQLGLPPPGCRPGYRTARAARPLSRC